MPDLFGSGWPVRTSSTETAAIRRSISDQSTIPAPTVIYVLVTQKYRPNPPVQV